MNFFSPMVHASMSNLPTHRPLRRVMIAVMGNLVLATLATAQFSSDTGDTGVGTGTDSGATAGGTSSFGSAMSASGASTFAGVERGTTIGSENVSGFGAAAESTGGGGGAAAGGGRAGGVGGLGGLGGLFGALGSAFGGQDASSTQPTIRVKLRSAVNVAPLDSRLVQRSANQVLSRVPVSTGTQNVRVTMNGRKATLTGIVGSDKERRMSELLLRLEPGVSSIDNQITVAQ